MVFSSKEISTKFQTKQTRQVKFVPKMMHYLFSTHCLILCAEYRHSHCGHQYRPLTVFQLKKEQDKEEIHKNVCVIYNGKRNWSTYCTYTCRY